MLAAEIRGAFRIQLAMAAAMASTTVETSSAMEPATTAVKAFASVEATAIAATAVPTTVAPSMPTATIVISAMAIVAAAAVKAIVIVESAAIIATTIEAVTVVAAVIPGASADEDAAEKVVRPVVAIWSASVRIVAVVTVGADWRWANGAVHGTYSNRYADLRVGAARGEKQNS